MINKKKKQKKRLTKKMKINNMKQITSCFINAQVILVSEFLQNYMISNNVNVMTADECAELLANNNILSNNIGPKSGFNFRQMLRDGRDGYIELVKGVSQRKPNARWYINRIN